MKRGKFLKINILKKVKPEIFVLNLIFGKIFITNWTSILLHFIRTESEFGFFKFCSGLNYGLNQKNQILTQNLSDYIVHNFLSLTSI